MNGTYTDQELLLLSNFVYIPASLSTRPIAEILDSYRDPSGTFTGESVAAAAAGGGMSVTDVVTVFCEMDKHIEDDPDFGKLSVSRCLEEKDVRALCYTGPKDNDPVVAFRGTGGTKDAWIDNFEGALYEDTRIQKIADDFIESECGIYRDIVVTGHSKGGNLAQYVTVKNEEMIKNCVSFDGQGFGDDFHRENKYEIGIASPKIKSVSAYNDFVNILLTGIAGTCIYVANEAGAAAAHSPTTLLTANSFDEDGNFITTRSQGAVAYELSRLTDRICSALSPFPADDKEVMSIIAGSAISLALTTPEDELMEGCLIPAAALTAVHLTGKMASVSKLFESLEKPVVRTVYIDTYGCRRASARIADQLHVIEEISRGVDEVRQNMSYTITTQIFAERALFSICERLTALLADVRRLSDLLRLVCDRYENAENEAALLMNL